ncbi:MULTISPECIES: class I SAM-dependent methyltransferase [Mycobacteriaceae]|uniref:class I SAM-dependent methyltransferase n=1 Tax=Mycobacteriaceae TaxID=1762 RepID=UPI000992BDB1|nr:MULTISPECIES: class I SAM-dependent methyltransferase [Mycobacteriaceae]MDM2175039.1 class I SAM-dependent methyltransferase [Mycobacteroides abscessus]SKL51249.1 methylase involved in ubiquinone/menaquinone biosynthesis [Mycobacteroides abscessus subsp. bolletii]MDM2179738.1 class I SAM-dependent methyltransferase [Mycobacteroides abscessus]MDM2207831.1 class I SAM-dependent methyltransferase [Mycobacteroides abscessus]MDM2211423.1 class I SAM-dependent methyltransferase [Mycobacteroides a
MARDWTRNRLKFFVAGPLFEAGDRVIPGHPHNRLAQLVADHHPARVLELCGGTGYTARLLAARAPDTAIDSVDISPEMLAVGRHQLARSGLRNVRMHEADAAELPFADDTFDVAMSIFGLHELPTDTRRRALDEVVRVLRPGGSIAAIDLDRPPSAQRVFNAYLRLTERPHARQVLGNGLADELTLHGLTVTEHRPAPGWARPFQIIQAHT